VGSINRIYIFFQVNSSKYAYNVSMKDVIQTITKSLFEIAASDQALPYFTSLKKVWIANKFECKLAASFHAKLEIAQLVNAHFIF